MYAGKIDIKSNAMIIALSVIEEIPSKNDEFPP